MAQTAIRKDVVRMIAIKPSCSGGCRSSMHPCNSPRLCNRRGRKAATGRASALDGCPPARTLKDFRRPIALPASRPYVLVSFQI